jgi:diadenosine tetraphosphate (Ap4A) HIT family hydrolase
MSQTLIHHRVAAADRGENPTVICRMTSGYLVFCDKQTPRGWCILISVPIVPDLDDLTDEQRAAFLSDMARVGKMLKQVTGAYRINYSILGNTDPALHAHIQPRFANETEGNCDGNRYGRFGTAWRRGRSMPSERRR